jgi:hypothetical protein
MGHLKRGMLAGEGNGSVFELRQPPGELGRSSPRCAEPYDGEGSQDERGLRKGVLRGFWQSLDRLETRPTMKKPTRGPSTTGAAKEGPLWLTSSKGAIHSPLPMS